MSVYLSNKNGRVLTSPQAADKINNQVVLTGADQYLVIPKGSFFLETFYVASGQTITVCDGQGNSVIPVDGAHTFNQENSPLRLDYGIIISGTVGYAKGYKREGIIS